MEQSIWFNKDTKKNQSETFLNLRDWTKILNVYKLVDKYKITI